MKVLVGLVMGCFSGFLIYVASAMLFTDGELSTTFVFVTFIGGWALSSFILVRGTRTISRVFSRGFLLGAAEWLAMIPTGMVISGKALSESVTSEASNAEVAGATIGAGLVSFITGGVAVAMALVCLVGFAISYFTGREMQPEAAAPTQRCPECAELIQAEARRCRYCGSIVVAST